MADIDLQAELAKLFATDSTPEGKNETPPAAPPQASPAAPPQAPPAAPPQTPLQAPPAAPSASQPAPSPTGVSGKSHGKYGAHKSSRKPMVGSMMPRSAGATGKAPRAAGSTGPVLPQASGNTSPTVTSAGSTGTIPPAVPLSPTIPRLPASVPPPHSSGLTKVTCLFAFLSLLFLFVSLVMINNLNNRLDALTTAVEQLSKAQLEQAKAFEDFRALQIKAAKRLHEAITTRGK